MEEIVALKEKLQKIAEARKINAQIRQVYKKKLQKIDAEIFLLTQQNKEEINTSYYTMPKIWGMKNEEYSRLTQLFWGKFHHQTDEQIESDKKGYIKFPTDEKRMLYLNQFRSTRQRATLIKQEGFFPLFSEFAHVLSPPIHIKPHSIHDIVRFYIFTQTFGISFPIHQIYPHISSKTMRNAIKIILKDHKDPQSLESYGVDCEKLQDDISTVLATL
ncbi:hypothetical protein TRFO_20444 [Tritrichomonas foetus]|uniref:Uncharacterized protein n=1 Tax=Tritrichomonas foetus TaxID=1144522 RepID=A0A1J4KLR1_9EUKA|nr:hypothetical protein TRFO_20444 [Tritrichomonas foetus]|eukprot:OHT10317.1 hypothetical protein TRFO_20444 [Tritrichomonas foetus]